MKRRPFTVLAAVVAVLATYVISLGTSGGLVTTNPNVASPVGSTSLVGTPFSALTRSHPNIVFILTDDQRYDELSTMPFLRRFLVGHGRTLKRYFVVNPLCCPSRASTLTGLYSHSTGIYLNGDSRLGGGFPDFNDRSTIALWLRRAGYRTGLIGKYLNHYDVGGYVPPGWSYWRAHMGARYYDYDVSIFGRSIRHYGSAPQDYATDVFARMADRFIRSTPSDRPLFLYFAPTAPHGPATPPPRYLNTQLRTVLPRYPDFNEANVSDKPVWIRERPRLTSSRIAKMRDRWIRSARTLLAVDDAIRRIAHALSDTGRLHDTLFVFTSDNGVSDGEHRLTYKLNVYEESIRVPFVVRWDRHIPAGTTSRQLATNIDLAPTFAAVGGAATSAVEGVSLVPLFIGNRVVRQDFLIEHQHDWVRRGSNDPPTYCAIRTRQWKLVHLEGEGNELYHLAVDPYELHNMASSPAAADTRHRLMKRLRILCYPRPPGMPPF